MPTTTIHWHGLTEWNAALRTAEDGINKANRAAIVTLGAMAEREAKANFVGSHRRGMPHVGGVRPNVVTGNLRRSITQTGAQPCGIASWKTTIYPSAIYSRAVELGRQGHNGAYPFFGPAIRIVRNRADAIMFAAWAKYV